MVLLFGRTIPKSHIELGFRRFSGLVIWPPAYTFRCRGTGGLPIMGTPANLSCAQFVRKGPRARVRVALLTGTALVSAAFCVAVAPRTAEAANCNATDTGSLASCITNPT